MAILTSTESLCQNAAVLVSDRSLGHYVNQAQSRGETYAFTDARGRERHWLKGEYAYLAVNATSTLLHRYNIKHDHLREEDGLSAGDLDAYQTLFVPNAECLATSTIETIRHWLCQPGVRLIVTGKTNLPNEMLGLSRRVPFTPAGYTGWCWTPASAFSDTEAWEPFYVTSYAGYTAEQVQATADAIVLAELYEFTGDLRSSLTANTKLIGDGIILTEKTLYVANQFLEFFGGLLQGHVNLEAIRHWYNPTHWGDTLAYLFERVLRRYVQPDMWKYRLRSFGSYEGVLSFRHDVDHSSDLEMLTAQVEQLVPATYNILDHIISPAVATEEQMQTWVRETARHNFLEAALHNDGHSDERVIGTGLADHVNASERHMGITLYTLGRHGGRHYHPETLDAMDYLYDTKPDIVGLCTFAHYLMLEYGQAVPGVGSASKPMTYNTDRTFTLTCTGFWWPYHAVITSVEAHKTLRGWDLTHEYDCNYGLIDVLYQSHHSRSAQRPKLPQVVVPLDSATSESGWINRGANFDRLENGVYTLQYHPRFACDPRVNRGKGPLPWLQYAIQEAERLNYWIANKKMLYERMSDYQDVLFRVDREHRILLLNPTQRRIEGLMVESDVPVRRVADGMRDLVHIVGNRFFTVPPLDAGNGVELELSNSRSSSPIIRQASHRGLQILGALYDLKSQQTVVEVSVARKQSLLVEMLNPQSKFRITISEQEGTKGESKIESADEAGMLLLELKGPQDGLIRQTVWIEPH